MKYKVLFCLMIAGIVCVVFVVGLFDKGNFNQRYHQHLKANKNAVTNVDFSDFKTHLPVINISTNGQKIPGAPIFTNGEEYVYELSENGKEEIKASITIYEKNKNPMQLSALIHYRGHTSRFFNKKSYDIGLVDDSLNKMDAPLLGMEKDNNWALHGPYLDRTLIRNYLAMNLAGEIMPFAPDVRFVELFVDNRYEGLYVLMEKVSKGEGRVPISTPERNSQQTSYIVGINRSEKIDVSLENFLTDTYKVYPSGVELLFPNDELFTQERYEYVKKDFSYIAHAISQIPSVQDVDYKQLIDVNAFYDYFILNELFRNGDAGIYSTYFYRDLRGKLTPVVWDFNNSLNNYQSTIFDETGFSLTYSVFYIDLLKDEKFVKGLVDRYQYLRKTKLSTTRLHQYIDDTVAFLGEAVNRNNERWSEIYDLSKYDIYNYLIPVERNVKSYDEAIQQMKDYIEKRGKWLDEHIESLYQYSHPSRHSHESIK